MGPPLAFCGSSPPSLFRLKILGKRFGTEVGAGGESGQLVPGQGAAGGEDAVAHEASDVLVAGIDHGLGCGTLKDFPRYGVMELGLFKSPYLAAGEYTIADMICYPWAAGWKLRKIDLGEFPNVKRWMEELEARPAVQKAMAAGAEYQEDVAKLSDEEKTRRAKLLYNQRATPIPKEWSAKA